MFLLQGQYRIFIARPIWLRATDSFEIEHFLLGLAASIEIITSLLNSIIELDAYYYTSSFSPFSFSSS